MSEINKDNLPLAIFLMGPTASGKTALAVELAEKINAEIISVDSALVYKGMDIGTAKPSMEERKGIKHHLIDIIDPADAFSTGSFRSLALALMSDITSRGKVPLLTGGTMLYFNSLFNGLADLPEANPEIRKKLDNELVTKGKDVLYQRLKRIDPESAERIHRNDPQRIQRALEVFEISGKSMTQFFREAQQNHIPYKKIKIIVAPKDRKLLHEKIAKRFKLMIEQGLLGEVDALLQRGDLTEKMPSIRAVGYRQIWAYLHGEYNLDMAVEKGIIATRQLAKRQFTWLRREQDSMQFVSAEKNLVNNVWDSIKPYF